MAIIGASDNALNPNTRSKSVLRTRRFTLCTSTVQAESGKPMRSGRAEIKLAGTLAGWKWKPTWLVLTEHVLDCRVSEHKSSRSQAQIWLKDISKLERNELRPNCLMVQANGGTYHLSFSSDQELYDWQDDIYENCPLSGSTSPSNFKHQIHVGFDPVTGEFSGLPSHWNAALGITSAFPGERPKSIGRNIFNADLSKSAVATRPLSEKPLALIPVLPNTATATSPTATFDSSKLPQSPMSAVSADSPILSGPCKMKVTGTFMPRWRARLLVLSPDLLSVQRSRTSIDRQIALKDVTRVERVDLKPCCLLLEAQSKRFLLWFQRDEELYNWQDEIYSRSGSNIGLPTGFTHHTHVGYDNLVGAYTGLPENWSPPSS